MSLLIVHPEEFRPAALRLMEHKKSTGMPAYSYGLDEMIAGVAGHDDAEKLKRAIFLATRDTRAVRYVLLLGDAFRLPVRYRRTPQILGFNGNPYSDWYTAADLYYANLYLSHTADGDRAGADPRSGFSDWDADRNFFYDVHHWAKDDIVSYNPDRVDGCPDIAVGRVPAHTLDDADLYVSKVIAYETGPGSPNYAVFVAEQEYDTSASMVDTIINQSRVRTEVFDAPRIGYGYPPGSTLPPGFRSTPIEQAASQALFLTYLGHGSFNSWGHGDDPNYDVLSAGQVGAFVNGTQPVVVSIGCSTGAWVPGAPDDYGQGYLDIHGLGHTVSYQQRGTTFTVTDVTSDGKTKTWTLHDNAHKMPVMPPAEYDMDRPSPSLAVGWLFNRDGGGLSFSGETAVGPDNFGADFATGLFQAYHGPGTVLGDMWLAAGQRYWTKYKNSNDSIGAARIYLTYMTLLGDPSLRIRVRPAHLPAAPSPRTVWGTTWSTGWTSMVGVTADGASTLVSYKSATGRAAIDRIQTGLIGTTPIWDGTLPPGYSLLAALPTGDVPQLLASNPVSGAIAVYRVALDPTPGLTQAWTATWTPGWTSIVPFELDGQAHLLEYKVADGTVAVDRVDNTGTTEIWRSRWTTGWTSMLSIQIGSRPALFSYKSGDGSAAIDLIDPTGQGTTPWWTGTWTSGWTQFSWLALLNRLFSYRVGDGMAAIDQIDPATPGTQEIWRGGWRPGLSTIAPITNTVPGGVGYAAATSDATTGAFNFVAVDAYHQPG